MNSTKKCIRCHKRLPLDAFYKHEGYRENRCPKCKCELQRLDRLMGRRSSPVQSNMDAKRILEALGFFVVFGRDAGYPYVDLVADGVPIEVKALKLNLRGQYVSSFTAKQSKNGFDAELIMAMRYEENEVIDIWIVPANLDWIRFSKRGTPRKSLCVTFSSDHGNSYMVDLLKPYKDAFHLINEAKSKYLGT